MFGQINYYLPVLVLVLVVLLVLVLVLLPVVVVLVVLVFIFFIWGGFINHSGRLFAPLKLTLACQNDYLCFS